MEIVDEKSYSYSAILTLYDDDSVKEKLTIMDKYEVIVDDGRNPDFTAINNSLEDFLTLGKSYEVTVTWKEI